MLSDERTTALRSGLQVDPAGAQSQDPRIGSPGEFPYTRGIYPTMYTGQLWSKRQLIGLDTAENFNVRQRELIEAGQSAISLTVCNSTYRGFDIDEVPLALVGTCGTPINCQEDVRIAFDGIDIGSISIALNDPTPFTVAARLFVLAEERGVPWTAIRGTSNQSDFLSHYVANHMFLRLPPRPALRALVDHAVFTMEHVPQWNPISVVGQHMQQAGATPLQSLAFTLATAMEYVRAVMERDVPVDRFGHRVTFFHDISMSFFEEIAKLRAQRRMWAMIMRDRFGAQDPRTQRFKVHTQTSGADLTQQEPLNNLVRVTVQAMAAVLGGTQSLHTDAYDEAYATPAGEAARLALMTQHILAEETGIAEAIDPLGGSYYVEALTDEMERAGWELLEEVERRGGMLAACESGFVQSEIGRSAWEFQRDVETGHRSVIGVNRYRAEDAAATLAPPVQRVDAALVQAQLARVQASRDDRDPAAAKAATGRLLGLATDLADNVFAATVDAVRAGLTHGEIVRALREAVGTGHPVDVV